MFANKIAMGLAALATVALAAPTKAQSTFADKFVKRFEGRWVTERGRNISFEIRDLLAKFTDEVEPGYSMTGTYRQGDGNADLVLVYPAGFKCSYLFTFPTNGRGNEMALTLVRSQPDGPEAPPRFRCIPSGTLKRTS